MAAPVGRALPAKLPIIQKDAETDVAATARSIASLAQPISYEGQDLPGLQIRAGVSKNYVETVAHLERMRLMIKQGNPGAFQASGMTANPDILQCRLTAIEGRLQS